MEEKKKHSWDKKVVCQLTIDDEMHDVYPTIIMTEWF